MVCEFHLNKKNIQTLAKAKPFTNPVKENSKKEQRLSWKQETKGNDDNNGSIQSLISKKKEQGHKREKIIKEIITLLKLKGYECQLHKGLASLTPTFFKGQLYIQISNQNEYVVYMLYVNYISINTHTLTQQECCSSSLYCDTIYTLKN